MSLSMILALPLAQAEATSTTFAQSLTKTLEPAAAAFRAMNLPEPLTHWGHPFSWAS